MQKIVEIYTDGACRGNPGPGGWGALLRYNDKEKHIYGSEPHTTNNRMELTAAIEAINSLKRPCKIILWTDSEYLRRGVLEWMVKWQQQNWKTSTKKPVKNVDLWQRLNEAIITHDIEWRWVKGHAGNPGNEMADELANRAIDEMGTL